MTLALSTSSLVQNSGLVHRETGWLEVARGFTLILRGYLLLTVTTLAGAGFFAYGQSPYTFFPESAPRSQDELMTWEALGVTLLLFGPVTSCVLVLLGQWR